MIGIPETDTLEHTRISANINTGYQLTTADGRPARMAIIDEDGNVKEWIGFGSTDGACGGMAGFVTGCCCRSVGVNGSGNSRSAFSMRLIVSSLLQF